MRDRIIEKFITYRACAKALNISEDNLSNKLKRRSRKFLHQLKHIGVNLPELDYGFTLEVKNKFVKENPQQYKTLMDEIASLKSELSETKKLITLSVNRITELEKENNHLRAEAAALLKTIAELGGGEIGNKL